MEFIAPGAPRSTVFHAHSMPIGCSASTWVDGLLRTDLASFGRVIKTAEIRIDRTRGTDRRALTQAT
jgi:hypothetical protein